MCMCIYSRNHATLSTTVIATDTSSYADALRGMPAA